MSSTCKKHFFLLGDYLPDFYANNPAQAQGETCAGAQRGKARRASVRHGGAAGGYFKRKDDS
ncbi:MAG: hypothetical protein EA338_00570 [Roseinatronobacter sp.]|nr:MAG: hypothetical protein EA338_00570 [Roseinatronobacter sp.]